jgi:imidazolonepropionase-like amidohydrolase
VLPSLYLPTKMLANALFTWEQDKIKADRDAMCAILPRAAAAGVKLCVGDDYGAAGIPHGEYNGEMAFYVDHAGVSALEVLKWATRNGGELMGRGEELGTIEVGKLADLLVVDGDPSRDITILGDRSRLLHIMLGGRFVGGSRQKPTETAGGGW